MGSYSTTVVLMVITVVLNTLLSLLLAWVLKIFLKGNEKASFKKLFGPTWIAGFVPTILAAFMYERAHGIPFTLVLRDLLVVWAVLQMVSVMWLTSKYKVVNKRKS
jgi:hypothetical protein